MYLSLQQGSEGSHEIEAKMEEVRNKKLAVLGLTYELWSMQSEKGAFPHST